MCSCEAELAAQLLTGHSDLNLHDTGLSIRYHLARRQSSWVHQYVCVCNITSTLCVLSSYDLSHG